MSHKPEKLQPEKCYHIFNQGNNGIEIFMQAENYSYFLKLYRKYIDPIADTLAWSLLPNHFHVLIRVKELDSVNLTDFHFTTTKSPKTIDASKQFAHLLNAYTQAVNKRFQRTGSLFENPFRRTEVVGLDIVRDLIVSIQQVPKTQGICDSIAAYKWTSYWENKKNPKLILKYFNDLQTYDRLHTESGESTF
ncbi:MAG: hypothetical protein EOO50_06155 [Flavobacterium sp.]|uniref:hypothetical protein n=1 Tax=Flavobacterium sp. TaxID=239 RepID=UPI001217153B|nr:hypothetical protein [Flavobacterium sp.]RZJ67325.1 MAG: hypothetical protein EOO50_06155 [Flavobacterium sp.]